MHAGQMATLSDVLTHYNQAPRPSVGISEVRPLGLTAQQLEQLEAFLRALSAPLDVESRWLRPPET